MDYQAGEILVIDKPLGWTSFDVVNKIRWHLCHMLHVKRLKVGHAGTLDPLATGVVIITTGKMTKRIDELQAAEKQYTATLQLGATTPSYDLEQPIDATYPTSHITRQLIDATLPRFVGEIWQTPPAFSAVKVDGKRAYQYARQGAEVQLKAKLLKIDKIDVISFEAQNMTLCLDIQCSKGTYIRALARDIGQALNSGAHLTSLRRTRVGQYTVDQAQNLDQLLATLTPQTSPTL